MKKRMIFVMICALLVVGASVFSACDMFGSANNDTKPPQTEQKPEPTPEPTPSAYEQLSETEKVVFNGIKDNFGIFINPASVKMLQFQDSFFDGAYYVFDLQMENGYGAKVTERFYLFTKIWVAPGCENTPKIYKGDKKEIVNGFLPGIYGKQELSELMMVDIAKQAVFYPKEDFFDQCKISVPKINAALREYYQEQGWI